MTQDIEAVRARLQHRMDCPGTRHSHPGDPRLCDCGYYNALAELAAMTTHLAAMQAAVDEAVPVLGVAAQELSAAAPFMGQGEGDMSRAAAECRAMVQRLKPFATQPEPDADPLREALAKVDASKRPSEWEDAVDALVDAVRAHLTP